MTGRTEQHEALHMRHQSHPIDEDEEAPSSPVDPLLVRPKGLPPRPTTVTVTTTRGCRRMTLSRLSLAVCCLMVVLLVSNSVWVTTRRTMTAALVQRGQRVQMEEMWLMLYTGGAPSTTNDAPPRSSSSDAMSGNRHYPIVFPPPDVADSFFSNSDGRGGGHPTHEGANRPHPPYQHELPLTIRVNNVTIGDSTRCEPYSAWHELSHPTCNVAHELDFQSSYTTSGGGNVANDRYHGLRAEYLAQGASRESWRIHRTDPPLYVGDHDPDGWVVSNHTGGSSARANESPLVLKTLRWKKEYTELSFERQRIDALASERLTSSPHVNGIYMFCGETVLNDFGDGGILKNFIWNSNETVSPEQRLIFARDAALGLADIHETGGDRNAAGDSVTTLAHHDIKLSNMLLVNGKLKIHDFNNAHLLKWNVQKDQRCGFHFRATCRVFKGEIESPKECSQGHNDFSEKVEVYRLGLILYFLLTDHQAGKRPPPHMKEIGGTEVLSNPPLLPRSVVKSEDLAEIAIRRAMFWALIEDEGRRPSARTIANYLASAAAGNMTARDTL